MHPTTEIAFLNLVTPRVGPVNAINAVHAARINALCALLVSKGLVTQQELNKAIGENLDKVSTQMLALAVPSPMQNRPPLSR